MSIEEWQTELGLQQYAPAFADNDIDFDLLKNLVDADLKELGVTSLGHRKRLLSAIAELGATAAPLLRNAEEGRTDIVPASIQSLVLARRPKPRHVTTP